jgi:hypothetical protein
MWEKMTMNETNVTRIMQLIIEASSKTDEPSALDLAEYLSENGVIAAPVKIGQTVYAGLSSIFSGEEDEVIDWEAKGLGIDEKGRYIAFDSYGEHYTVGEESCRLTIKEAEEDLRRFKETANEECRTGG